MNKRRGWSTIALSTEIKEQLDGIKHPGQSYGGLIRELAEFWQKAHPPKEAAPPGKKQGGKSG